MDKILLYHHMGLGDHSMCHGIVREYCSRYDEVVTFAKPHNHDSVCFMYRDLINLEVVKANDIEVQIYINKNPQYFVKYIGFGGLDYSSSESLDQQFYKMANVDLEHKYSSFQSLPRDEDREDKLFSELIPKNEEYIFFHDDTSRNMKIELSKGMFTLQADKKYTSCIFDYCKIIENAAEIHVIDSSFFFLTDCLHYHNSIQKLYCHRYIRIGSFLSSIEIPHHKKEWNILNEKL